MSKVRQHLGLKSYEGEGNEGIRLEEAKNTGRFSLFVFGVISFSLVAGGVANAYTGLLGRHRSSGLVGWNHLWAPFTIKYGLVLGLVFDRYRTAGGAIYVGVCMTITIVSLLMAKAEALTFVFAAAYGSVSSSQQSESRL